MAGVSDGNDLEDYYIALHLGVSSGRTFVTNDTGVRAAVIRTIAAFDEFATGLGATFARNVRIIRPDEFVRESES